MFEQIAESAPTLALGSGWILFALAIIVVLLYKDTFRTAKVVTKSGGDTAINLVDLGADNLKRFIQMGKEDILAIIALAEKGVDFSGLLEVVEREEEIAKMEDVFATPAKPEVKERTLASLKDAALSGKKRQKA